LHPLYSPSYASAEALPTSAVILFWSWHTKALQATANEGLAKVPVWQLEWDSNLRPSGCKRHWTYQ